MKATRSWSPPRKVVTHTVVQAGGAEGHSVGAGADASEPPAPTAHSADPIEVSGDEGPPAPPQAISGAPSSVRVCIC